MLQHRLFKISPLKSFSFVLIVCGITLLTHILKLYFYCCSFISLRRCIFFLFIYFILFSKNRDVSISMSNFFNTHFYHIIGQWHVMYDWWPFINSLKGNQARMIVINIQPTPIWCINVRVLSEGINTTFLCAHTGIRRSYIWLNWMWFAGIASGWTTTLLDRVASE